MFSMPAFSRGNSTPLEHQQFATPSTFKPKQAQPLNIRGLTTDQQKPIIQPQVNERGYPTVKPKTSVGSHRVQRSLGNDKNAEIDQPMPKGAIKMKIHNFDPFGMGEIGPGGLIMSGNKQSQLQIGQVNSQQLFLNTVHSGQNFQQLVNGQTGQVPLVMGKSKSLASTQQLGGLQQPKQLKIANPQQNQIRFAQGPPGTASKSKRIIMPAKKLNYLPTPPYQQPLIVTNNNQPSVPPDPSLPLSGNGRAPQLYKHSVIGNKGGSPIINQRKVLDSKNSNILNNMALTKQSSENNFQGAIFDHPHRVKHSTHTLHQTDGTFSSPFTNANNKFSTTDFNSASSQQNYGRNSDPLQMPSQYLLTGDSSKQQNTFINQQVIKQVSPKQAMLPVRNTQGLQGSIYSSACSSSVEGEQDVMMLQDQESKNKSPKGKFLQTVESGVIKPQSNSQNFFFHVRKSNQNVDTPQDSAGSPSQGLQFAQQRVDIRKGKGQKQMIAKHNINFAKGSLTQNTLEEENAERQQEEGEVELVKKKTINKLREAKQIADTFDKRGIDKAIFQYQFEIADKDEENCFNDLYDTLSGFF